MLLSGSRLRRGRHSMRLLVLAVAGTCLCQPLAADLKPDEIALVAVRQSRESEAIARHYIQARGLPNSQICFIDVKPGQNLGRSDWEQTVRPYIRRWLKDNRLESRIRCFVTVWDVPLKILKYSNKSPDVRARQDSLNFQRELCIEQVASLIDEVNGLMPAGTIPADPNSSAELPDISDRLETAILAAQQRFRESGDGAQAAAAQRKLLPMIEVGAGINAIVRGYSQAQPESAAARAGLEKQLEGFKGLLQGLREGREALEALPESVERDQQMLTLVQRSEGLIGSLAWIDLQMESLRRDESYASFDSELSLLHWPNYRLHRWQPNLLQFSHDDSNLRERTKTLMVSRLEAPTLELTKKLVDTAIAVEKQGLKGKVYLDARGIGSDDQPAPAGSYADFDKSVRNLAALLEQYTQLDVVLDNDAELYQNGDCPDAALYCGWYSLGKYVDAFQWNRGSVGYHLASREAATLRQRNSQVWCKRMLEEGVCATLGPVHEPYLFAFPRPDEFFIVLLSGKYTLVETYYRTKPFNSWVMTLVGDPLYNPFKNSSPFEGQTLPPELRRLMGE